MTRTVLIDEIHLSIRIPADLPDRGAVRVYQTLTSARFAQRLRRAIQGAVVQFPELATVTFTVRR